VILPYSPIPAKCPVCGSENVRTKWFFTTILARVGGSIAVPTVKVLEKRCGDCGRQFQALRK